MSWMRCNRLELNVSKAEGIWCSSARGQLQFPTTPITVGSTTVTPVRVVRDLGIYIDSGLTVQAHVARTVSSSCVVLQRIRSIHRSVTNPDLPSLLVSVVLTSLDYGSATRAGLPNANWLGSTITSPLHHDLQLVTSSGENSVPSGSARFSLPAWH